MANINDEHHFNGRVRHRGGRSYAIWGTINALCSACKGTKSNNTRALTLLLIHFSTWCDLCVLNNVSISELVQLHVAYDLPIYVGCNTAIQQYSNTAIQQYSNTAYNHQPPQEVKRHYITGLRKACLLQEDPPTTWSTHVPSSRILAQYVVSMTCCLDGTGTPSGFVHAGAWRRQTTTQQHRQGESSKMANTQPIHKAWTLSPRIRACLSLFCVGLTYAQRKAHARLVVVHNDSRTLPCSVARCRRSRHSRHRRTRV